MSVNFRNAPASPPVFADRKCVFAQTAKGSSPLLMYKCAWCSICYYQPLLSNDTNDPFRPLATRVKAAAQFHQTGHSCITQHFHVPDGCRAGQSRRALNEANRHFRLYKSQQNLLPYFSRTTISATFFQFFPRRLAVRFGFSERPRRFADREMQNGCQQT